MLMLFTIVIVGFGACKLGYMSEEFDKKLSSIVVDITCPALILSSVMGDKLPDGSLIVPLIVISTITYILLTLVAVLLPKLVTSDKTAQGIIGFAMMFGNVGFIGYPIAASIFGHQAIFYAAILNISNTFFIFTVGKSLIMGGGYKVKLNTRTFLCPGLVSAYISILIVALGITGIPEIISKPVSMIGNITVPASLLIIGSAMARLPMKSLLGNMTVYFTSAIRLFLVPISLYYAFTFLGFDHFVTGINSVIIGMPVAAYGTIFCLKYGKDTTLMTETTFITSIVSIISIPLLSMIVC